MGKIQCKFIIFMCTIFFACSIICYAQDTKVKKEEDKQVGKKTQEPAATVAKDKKPESGQTEEKVKKQAKCPVTGKDIKKEIFVYYNEKKIYFSDKECLKKFYVDPEKYVKVLLDEKITIEDWKNHTPVKQSICPFTGDKINMQYRTPVEIMEGGGYISGTIAFCSQECLDSFEKMDNPTKSVVVAKLKDFGFDVTLLEGLDK